MTNIEKYLSCLIIEDNPGDFILISKYLKEVMPEVVISNANTFAGAKKLLQSDAYKIILLDLSLPDRSGEQLVSDVVQIAGGAPVIVFTNYNDKKFGIKTLSLGVADYLLKDKLNPELLNKSITYSLERTRIHSELNNSEEQYRSLFNMSPIPMWVFNTETLFFLKVNEAAIRHYGFTREEFLSMPITALRIPEMSDEVISIANQNEKKGQPFEGIFTHVKKNGEEIIVDIQSNYINYNGKPARMILSTDITAKHFQDRILSLEKEIYKLNTTPGISFDDVLDNIMTNVELMMPSVYCSILELNSDQTLTLLKSPTLPPAYAELLNGLSTGPRKGSCCTGMHNGKTVVVSDIDNDPLWADYRGISSIFGLKACWSVPIKKSDGTVMGCFAFYYKTVKTPHPDEINLLERVSSLVGIIKENRDSLEEMNISNERYNMVAKATSDTVWDYNLLNDTITWNQGLQQVFGYKQMSAVTTADWCNNKIHPDDRKRVIRTIERQVVTKKIRHQYEYRFLCADGSYKNIFDRSFLVIDGNGSPVKLIGAMQDVTKQKEEEHKIKLLQSVVTNATDAIIITQAGTSENEQCIIYVNEAFTKMSGYSKEEVIGRSPRFLQGPKTDRLQLDKIKKAIETKSPCEIEVINYKKNGEEFYVQMTIAPVTDEEGNCTHFISIERDVTENKKFDHEITKAIINAQEQERSQIGGELHDNVNQILAGVQLALGMAHKEKKLSQVKEWVLKSRNYIHLAIKENRKLSHQLAPACFDENSMQDAFDGLLASINVENKFTINLVFNSFDENNVNGDIQLNLYRILQEQVNNILKYSEASVINITVTQDEENLQLCIHDNGIGFDTATAKRGIGLNNIKKRTELFGGSFRLNTAPGKGCEITVDIPLMKEETKKTKTHPKRKRIGAEIIE